MASGKCLILIGPMGSGKTTVGSLLAKELGWVFLDTDRLIVEESGMPIPEIFTRYGEEYFRRLETAVIAKAVSQKEAVIATGGGAVTVPANLQCMKDHGVVIYLKTSLQELARRVGSGEGRPLLAGRDPFSALQTLLEERESQYSQSDLVICTDGLIPGEVAQRILAEYQNFFRE
ncbi:MAG TPA: shikimate kinase [Firmicutes bacterium]|jgi:shikimate kinase|nr:shikimate kinase [Bacillota bacterium]